MLTIEDRVRTAVSDALRAKIGDVRVDSRLFEDLEADSLDRVEIAIAVEEQFEIEISDEDIEAAHTVADFVRLVESRTGAGL